MKKKACIVDIKKNSWKNTSDNHLSTFTFVIYRHPVTLFTRDADWHKLATDLFYDFAQESEVLSIIRYRSTSKTKIAGQLQYNCPAIFEVPLYLIIDRTSNSCGFCEHFTCLSSKIQNAIKLENISNLITSPSSYQCIRRKARLVYRGYFVIHGRHISMECMWLCAYWGSPNVNFQNKW